MIRKCKSLMLVWVLAFLQCLVPLLHAHAGGMQASGAAHIHLDGVHVGEEAHGFPELRADQCDTPSVGAPAELRRDQVFPGDLPFAVFARPILPIPSLEHVLAHVVPPSCHSCFSKPTPPAQAPPAVSRFL